MELTLVKWSLADPILLGEESHYAMAAEHYHSKRTEIE